MKLIIVAFALLVIVIYKTDPGLSNQVDNYVYTVKSVVTDAFARASNWARGYFFANPPKTGSNLASAAQKVSLENALRRERDPEVRKEPAKQLGSARLAA